MSAGGIHLVLTDKLREAARRCVWFERPEAALREPARLAAYIFTYGSHDDVSALTEQITADDLRQLLDAAPPGIFDARSWAYWNLMAGRYTAPPMSRREL